MVIEKAGPYVDVIVYPISKGRVDRHERTVATHCSSDLRQKANDRTSAQKFKRLMAANFSPRDFVVTLTYSDDALPATPELARDRHLKPFVRKLREDFRSYGEQLKYMYVTEGLHGDKRLHHHIIVPDTLDIRDTIRDLWQRSGQNVGFERIGSRGYQAWASYLTKEPRKTGRRYVGQRMWTPSLNLKKPDISKYEVTDDYIFEPPAGVVIELNETVQTEWFACQYVSYREPHYWSES